MGFDAEIARKGVPAPIQIGKRWVVQKTNSWMNSFGKSGGPVLASRADGSAESRGNLSAAGGEVDYGFEYVYWTETPRILSAFGGTLITTD